MAKDKGIKHPVPRATTGCLTCRERKIKCDEAKPICRRCQRLWLDCRWKDQQGPGEKGAKSSDTSNQDILVIPAARSVSLQKLRLPGETFVLEFPNVDRSALPYIHHFISFCSRFLAYSNDSQANPFYEELVPLATTSPALLHSMVALAAGHLARVHPGHEATATKHYSMAVKELQTTLSDPAVARSNSTLGASLLLCVYEISRSDKHVWDKHLQGARDLIIYRGGPEPSNFLTRFFSYLDVAGSIFAGRPPLISGNYWIEDPSSHEEGSSGSSSKKREWPHYDSGGLMVDHFQELMVYMAQLSSLSAESLTDFGQANPAITQQRAHKIRDDLLDWWRGVPPALSQLRPDWRATCPKLSAPERLEKEALASTKSVALACIIYLNHIVDPFANQMEKGDVAQAVDEILAFVDGTPENSGLEMGLFYGLFTVGAALFNDPEREAFVRRKLEADTKACLYHADGALELLGIVWEKQHRYNRRFDWRIAQEELGGNIFVLA